ncbi:MAG: hypothetical protein J5988_00495 [Eubacterium sp.]|nr:hypothetical protein [Eubacterium sp.]
MVDVYNLYLGGYLPKVDPKTNVHNKRELKTKYKNIVSLNNANPLVMVKLSNDTQAYALDVKEMSMELGEAARNVNEGQEKDERENLKKMTEIFNRLLRRSDEYGAANGRPSRPGGELRNLVTRNAGELVMSGITVDEKGFLAVDEGKEDFEIKNPSEFTIQLAEKCEQMSMNPMEYVEKKVYSYAHLYRSDVGTAYESSMYSGMLFNSYC